MDPREMVNRRTLIGGPAPIRVREEIQSSRKLLEKNREKVKTLLAGLAEAERKLEKAIDALIGN